MLKKLLGLSCLVVIFLLATNLQAATFNVTTSVEFQTALMTAQANGQNDTINVAAGAYNVGATLTYSTEEDYDLAIVGAGATTTILDGGGERQCLNLTNNSGGGISVSGLTCRNGRAVSLGGGLAINCVNGAATLSNCRLEDNVSDRSAGGAYIGGLNGAVTVDSCVVDGNSLDPVTGDDGGGLDIYIDIGGTADITLENSTITNNYIGECPSAVGSPDGAGVFMYHLGSGGTITVRNNTISDNTALGGPAGFYFRAPVDSTLVFEGNTVSGNASGRSEVGASGGGVHIQMDIADVTFSNNKILNNRAIGPWANGGGVDLAVETSGSCEIINNAFAGNTAQQHGGGMSLSMAEGLTRAVVAGNLFVNNEASTEDGSGGGLMLNGECNVTMANNTFYNNSASDAGGLGYYTEGTGRSLTLANDIYWSNTPDSISNMGTGSLTATYSNVQGGSGESWFGAGCIDANPAFFNTASPQGADGIYATVDDGLHLTAASPSMNTGNNTFVPGTVTTDIAGENRIQNTTVDMGAYEGVAGTPTLEAPKLTVTITGTTVSFSWTSVAGATGYTLSYAPYPYTGPDSIVSVDMGTQTGISVNLWKGAAFYVAVQANNSAGSSGYSNIEYFVVN